MSIESLPHLSTGGHNLRVFGTPHGYTGTTSLVQGKVHNREQWVCILRTVSELLGILCQSPVAHLEGFFVKKLLFARGSLPRRKASSLICGFGHFWNFNVKIRVKEGTPSKGCTIERLWEPVQKALSHVSHE